MSQKIELFTITVLEPHVLHINPFVTTLEDVRIVAEVLLPCASTSSPSRVVETDFRQFVVM
jgi:hypothetical protein